MGAAACVCCGATRYAVYQVCRRILWNVRNSGGATTQQEEDAMAAALDVVMAADKGTAAASACCAAFDVPHDAQSAFVSCPRLALMTHICNELPGALRSGSRSFWRRARRVPPAVCLLCGLLSAHATSRLCAGLAIQHFVAGTGQRSSAAACAARAHREAGAEAEAAFCTAYLRTALEGCGAAAAEAAMRGGLVEALCDALHAAPVRPLAAATKAVHLTLRRAAPQARVAALEIRCPLQDNAVTRHPSLDVLSILADHHAFAHFAAPYAHCLARPLRLAAAAGDDDLLCALLAITRGALPASDAQSAWCPPIADARALVSALLAALPAEASARLCHLGHGALSSMSGALTCLCTLLCANGTASPAWLALRAAAMQRLAACAEAWPLGLLTHVLEAAAPCALVCLAALGSHAAAVHESAVRHEGQRAACDLSDGLTPALLRLADALLLSLQPCCSAAGPPGASLPDSGVLLAVWHLMAALSRPLLGALHHEPPPPRSTCTVAAHALRAWLHAGVLDVGMGAAAHGCAF